MPEQNKTGTPANGGAVGLRALPRRQIVITLVGVMLAMFLSSLDQTIVGTAMPKIIADLGGFSEYTWITTSYLITSTIVIPITGKLTDIYGRKWFYTVGIIIFTVGSLLCGLSQTMTQIIFFRGFQGLGAGVMMANAFTVIGDLFPPAERGKYQGAISAVFGLSAVIGPLLGGFITDNISWHWVFFINIPLGIAIILLFIFSFPNIKPDQLKHKIDYMGAAALVVAVIPFLLAMSWGGIQYPWASPVIIGMLVFSVIMAVVFYMIEKRASEPIIPLELFSNRIVAVSMVVIFLTGFAMFGGIIFIPLLFQGVQGLSATASGSFLTPMMLGMVFASFISGQSLSRNGRYRILGVIGLVVMAIGAALLWQMDIDASYATAIAIIVVAGFGLGITMPLYTIVVQNAVPYKIMGVATSSTAFFRSIGASFGLAVMGSIMTNRFVAEFMDKIPAVVKAFVPEQTLLEYANNPQALVSVEAQQQLKAMFSAFPGGQALYDQTFQAMRVSLHTSLSEVFFIGLIVSVIAMVFHFFIKEIPLRKYHVTSDENGSKSSKHP